MDWSKTDTPLDKMSGESLKANQALVDYAMLGGGRSLAILHQTYTEAAPEKPPTQQLRTLKGWSAKYAWQARVARFDALQHGRELEEWQGRAEELRQREWKLAMSLLDKAEQMLKFPLAEIEKETHSQTLPDGQTVIQHVQIVHPSKWFFGDAARVIKEASRVARLATGQPTDHSKHDGLPALVYSADEFAEARKKAQDFEAELADE